LEAEVAAEAVAAEVAEAEVPAEAEVAAEVMGRRQQQQPSSACGLARRPSS